MDLGRLGRNYLGTNFKQKFQVDPHFTFVQCYEVLPDIHSDRSESKLTRSARITLSKI